MATAQPTTVREPALPGPPAATQVKVAVLMSTALTDAGVRALLAPHHDRVVVRRPGGVHGVQIEIVDTGHESDLPTAAQACLRLALVWDYTARSIYRARALNAAEILLMSAGGDDLIAAIESLHSGARSSWREVSRNGDDAPGAVALSPREGDVMERICRGMSNDEIARELYLSLNTVKTHIRTAYQKMRVTSRAQAVLWGLGHGY